MKTAPAKTKQDVWQVKGTGNGRPTKIWELKTEREAMLYFQSLNLLPGFSRTLTKNGKVLLKETNY